MTTTNLIQQKLAEFDKKFSGVLVGPLSHEHKWSDFLPYHDIKSFLKSFAKDILKSVGEEVEGMKTEKYPERFNIDSKECKYCGSYRQEMHTADCDFIIEENRNTVIDDLRVRLKEMEKI